MKISTTLPQFTNETALLIVTGTQAATLYIASKGEITKVGAFDVPLPRYSDHEGKFARRGRGQSLSSSSVYEPNKVQHINEFLRELVARAKPLMLKYRVTATYLYSPRYLMPLAKESLAKIIGTTYVMSFQGNYHSEHPRTLLMMIRERQQRRVRRRTIVPTSREAENLLSRSAAK